MDEQGGSRGGDQVFALRQVVERTIDEAHANCAHFSTFIIKLTETVLLFC